MIFLAKAQHRGRDRITFELPHGLRGEYQKMFGPRAEVRITLEKEQEREKENNADT